MSGERIAAWFAAAALAATAVGGASSSLFLPTPEWIGEACPMPGVAWTLLWMAGGLMSGVPLALGAWGFATIVRIAPPSSLKSAVLAPVALAAGIMATGHLVEGFSAAVRQIGITHMAEAAAGPAVEWRGVSE